MGSCDPLRGGAKHVGGRHRTTISVKCRGNFGGWRRDCAPRGPHSSTTLGRWPRARTRVCGFGERTGYLGCAQPRLPSMGRPGVPSVVMPHASAPPGSLPKPKSAESRFAHLHPLARAGTIDHTSELCADTPAPPACRRFDSGTLDIKVDPAGAAFRPHVQSVNFDSIVDFSGKSVPNHTFTSPPITGIALAMLRAPLSCTCAHPATVCADRRPDVQGARSAGVVAGRIGCDRSFICQTVRSTSSWSAAAIRRGVARLRRCSLRPAAARALCSCAAACCDRPVAPEPRARSMPPTALPGCALRPRAAAQRVPSAWHALHELADAVPR